MSSVSSAFRSITLVSLGAAVACMGGAESSSATTLALTSPTVFASRTTGVQTGYFDNVPLNNDGGTWGGYVSPLSGYTGLLDSSFATDTGFVNVNGPFFYGPNDLSLPYLINASYVGDETDDLTITLPSAQTAFFLDFTTLFSSTTATFTLSNGFSTVVSNTVTIGDTPEFLGFVSNVPFGSITLSVPSQQSWVVASFGYGTASVVPEASTWTMMLLGFAGLGFGGFAKARRRVALG